MTNRNPDQARPSYAKKYEVTYMNKIPKAFKTNVQSLAIALVAALVFFGMNSTAQAVQLVEGQNYVLVSPPQPTSTKNKIEVRELFWYGCPHCFHLEPYVKRWLKTKPANVEFVRMPAVLNPSWELLARAYYTAQILGIVDKIHTPLFDAIHQKRQRMNSEGEIMEFFKKFGVPEDKFRRIFRSFAVETKIRRSRDMGLRYGARGVPTVIVNGKYRTGAEEAGSPSKVFKVVDQLIKLEESK
jgi:thiol:disulfide interchange protein DsbA